MGTMKNIKDLRASKGLTLKEVAERTGMSIRTVHRHEQGASSMSLEQARIYADLYDVTVDGLNDLVLSQEKN